MSAASQPIDFRQLRREAFDADFKARDGNSIDQEYPMVSIALHL